MSAGDEVRRRTVRPLMVGNIVQAMGIQIFAPILPIYLAHNDMSSGLIGLTMAAGIAGYGATQYPSGRIADTFDRKSVLLYGMLLYSTAFFLYLLPIPGIWIPLIRFLHAGLAGLYTISAIAVLADVTAATDRGRMFGAWQASTRFGFLIGPLLGGALATVSLEAAFLCAGSMCLLSAIVMTRLPRVRPISRFDGETGSAALPPARGGLVRPILPLILVGAGSDYTYGAFMAIWSLWLISHGASTLDVGLTFCLLALPSVLLSTWLGGLTDRQGPRKLVLVSYVGLQLVGPFCAWAHNLPVLALAALMAGVFTAVARPVVTAGASRLVPQHFQARAQSILFTGLMGVQLLAALVSGVLLAVSPYLAFGAITVVSLTSFVTALVLYGKPAARVTDPPEPAAASENRCPAPRRCPDPEQAGAPLPPAGP